MVQTIGEPAQEPAAVQTSLTVHASLSLQPAPAAFNEYEQVPLAQLPTGLWHWLGGVLQTIVEPLHAPEPLHWSLSVQGLVSLHAAPIALNG